MKIDQMCALTKKHLAWTLSTIRLPPDPWRRSVVLWCFASSTAFIVNLSFVVWVTARWIKVLDDGLSVVTQGDCNNIKAINSGIHVAINALSTLILAGSSYCMQVLAAPTRAQIDKAHACGRWVDIGVPSLRNLLVAVDWRNKFLWLVLALSSLPLHFLYNSAVFPTLPCNRYSVFLATEELLSGTATDLAITNRLHSDGSKDIISKYHDNKLKELDITTCIRGYCSEFQSDWGNLLVVSDRFHSYTGLGNMVFSYGGLKAKRRWFCGEFFRGASVKTVFLLDSECDAKINKWMSQQEVDLPAELRNTKCFATETSPTCRLLLSQPIAWVVVVMNLIQAAPIGYLVFVSRMSSSPGASSADENESLMRPIKTSAADNQRKPIITIGDA